MGSERDFKFGVYEALLIEGDIELVRFSSNTRGILGYIGETPVKDNTEGSRGKKYNVHFL